MFDKLIGNAQSFYPNTGYVFFGQQFQNRAAETALQHVFFNSNNFFIVCRRFQNKFFIKRFYKTGVDDFNIKSFFGEPLCGGKSRIYRRADGDDRQIRAFLQHFAFADLQSFQFIIQSLRPLLCPADNAMTPADRNQQPF